MRNRTDRRAPIILAMATILATALLALPGLALATSEQGTPHAPPTPRAFKHFPDPVHHPGRNEIRATAPIKTDLSDAGPDAVRRIMETHTEAIAEQGFDLYPPAPSRTASLHLPGCTWQRSLVFGTERADGGLTGVRGVHDCGAAGVVITEETDKTLSRATISHHYPEHRVNAYVAGYAGIYRVEHDPDLHMHSQRLGWSTPTHSYAIDFVGPEPLSRDHLRPLKDPADRDRLAVCGVRCAVCGVPCSRRHARAAEITCQPRHGCVDHRCKRHHITASRNERTSPNAPFRVDHKSASTRVSPTPQLILLRPGLAARPRGAPRTHLPMSAVHCCRHPAGVFVEDFSTAGVYGDRKVCRILGRSANRAPPPPSTWGGGPHAPAQEPIAMLVLFKNPLIVRIPSREDLGMPPLVHNRWADIVMCPACDAAAVMAADAASRARVEPEQSFWLTEPRKFGRAALGRAPMGIKAQTTTEVAP